MWLLAVVLLSVSCGRHSHAGGEMVPVDSLCMEMSKERYSDIEAYDTLIAELVSLPGINNETEMIAANAMAYSAMMHMDYNRSVELYVNVIDNSECEIERLVADVGMMTLCYRVSANRLFFDYRTSALARIRRIDEEYAYLTTGDKERFNRAKVEFATVSVCYFSNLSMSGEVEKVLSYLDNDLENVNDNYLRLYARMILANNVQDVSRRLSTLSLGLDIARKDSVKWLEGNYRLLLAISLRDSSMLRVFADEYPGRVAALLPEGSSLDELPRILAHEAVSNFEQYGDEYMIIEALAVEASCNIWIERYDDALVLLSGAYDRINGYYSRVYEGRDIFSTDSLFNEIELLVTNADSGVYNIPECLLSVCREASCAYAGLGDIDASVVNRDLYLELLRTTRLNKQFESRISAMDSKVARLEAVAVAVFALLVIFSLFLFFVYRRRLRREKSFSMQRKQLLSLCRMLLSSLPHDIDNKEQLLDAVSSMLNDKMDNFSGKTKFVFAPMDCSDALPYIYAVDIHYMNSSVCDRLTVASEEPLDDDKRSLVAMLVPYIAVSIEEGLRLSGISEEREKVEEMKRASAIYLTEHKRENVLKRVSVSIVSGMRPFMDRISNELNVLTSNLSADDTKRKLQYVSELTEKLDDLNVILERWIKTRQGELNLRIENFSLSSLFAIIEKNSKLFDARGISLMVKPADIAVKADKALTLFMINTLVDNAAKFTLEGGCVVLEAIEENDFVEIAVTDTGIGMSKDDVDRISGAKVYDASLIGADNDLMKPKSKGSGFGLMNCKGIIEKYRKAGPLFSVCSFDITSTKCVGSRFSFRLPKGLLRIILVLLSFLPLPMQAGDLFVRLNEYADSVFMCNVNGNHEDAFVVAQEALDLLNGYYRKEVGGNDTLSLCSGNAAEISWWNQSVYPDSLREQVYFNILDIRNEVAIASLALNNWGAYRYNNFIYSTLYRLVDEDKGIAERYSEIRQVADRYQVAVALSCMLILLLFIYYIITLVRHNVIEKTNERLVLEMNGRLLKVATQSGRRTIEELAQNIVDEFYACMGETMRIKVVSLLLDAGKGSGQLIVSAPDGSVSARDGARLEHLFKSGESIVMPSGVERATTLYAVNDGERTQVGVLEVVTERPLSENESVSLELVANYLASVAYHSAVRVARGYMALEELEEEAERVSYEENRMHVQNMVMDNCLSMIKHETVYYPNRIRELAVQALSSVDGSVAAVADMRELMDYYSSVFGILSNCAVRELDSTGLKLTDVRLAVLFENARRYAIRLAKRRGVDIVVVYEDTDAVVKIDADLVDFLFEQLLSAAFKVEKNGTLLLRALEGDGLVKVELVDDRYVIPSDEAAELFTPTKRNVNDVGGVNYMEYLVAKEIVRIHEDYTGKHGGRMEASSDVSGTVILFTLPK